MGHIYAELKLTNSTDVALVRRGLLAPEEVRSVELTALVDTGANTLVIDEKTCRAIGLEITGERFGRVADGKIVATKMSEPVDILFKNRLATCPAIVLPEVAQPLLGCIPIEQMDVILNPADEEMQIPPDRPDVAVLNLLGIQSFDGRD